MRRIITAIWLFALVTNVAIGIPETRASFMAQIWLPAIILILSLFVFQSASIYIRRVHHGIVLVTLVAAVIMVSWLALFSKGAQSGVGVFVIAMSVSNGYLVLLVILLLAMGGRRFIVRRGAHQPHPTVSK